MTDKEKIAELREMVNDLVEPSGHPETRKEIGRLILEKFTGYCRLPELTAISDVKYPIHEWFELTYASYLVLPRSILQSAPIEWQRRFVACLEELGKLFGDIPETGEYYVNLKDDDGKFIHDNFRDYERGRRHIPQLSHDNDTIKGAGK